MQKKIYSINFTVIKKKFCLSLFYNGANSNLFVNAKEIYKLKEKDSEIVAAADNMRKKNLTIMSMILVLIMVLLMLMILLTFTNI